MRGKLRAILDSVVDVIAATPFGASPLVLSPVYSSAMTHRVLLFASWSDALGPQVDVDLPAGAKVSDLLADLTARAEGKTLPRPLVAVNHRYARADVVLAAGDEVAIIPPVAGG